MAVGLDTFLEVPKVTVSSSFPAIDDVVLLHLESVLASS